MRLLVAAMLVLGAAPALADEPEFEVVGFTCGWLATNDPVGVVDPDPERHYSVLEGGPMVVAALEPVINTTMRCSLQEHSVVESFDADAPDLASATATSSGPVVTVPPTLVVHRYNILYVQIVCWELWWTTRSGTFHYRRDYDPVAPGVQCHDPRGCDICRSRPASDGRPPAAVRAHR